MKKTILTYFLILLSFTASAQLITIGPVLHCYFVKKKPQFSIGPEVGIHAFGVDRFLPAIVIGIEGWNKRCYIYGEFQVTTAGYNSLNGFAMGIYKKIEKETEKSIGLQATAWSAWFIGAADIRLRLSKKGFEGGLGTFAKYPANFNPIGHM